MDYAHLGRSGVSVSRLCLGTMNFGAITREADAHVIMDAAHEHGINFFDTSNTYGQPRAEGVTESVIGRWMAVGSGRRDRTVLATKLYGGKGEWPNDRFLSAFNIRRACEESLRRLGTDHIDLYQMHHVDRSTPWDEIWEAMDVLRTQGKIIYAGSSNFAGWHIAQAQEAAARRPMFGLVSEQSLYNLAARTVELEVLPACQGYGIGVIPWSPLHGGLLSGVLRRHGAPGAGGSGGPDAGGSGGPDAGGSGGPGAGGQDTGPSGGRSSGGRAAEAIQEIRPQIEAYEAFCADLGEDPAVVALAWLLHQPAVTAPIVGPRTLDQLTGALRALEVTLDEKTLGRLDEIFPGPGGAAPEAYAW
jgi:aryl-alcohol dehydrogenase-like predicted oxidoreductase